MIEGKNHLHWQGWPQDLEVVAYLLVTVNSMNKMALNALKPGFLARVSQQSQLKHKFSKNKTASIKLLNHGFLSQLKHQSSKNKTALKLANPDFLAKVSQQSQLKHQFYKNKMALKLVNPGFLVGVLQQRRLNHQLVKRQKVVRYKQQCTQQSCLLWQL